MPNARVLSIESGASAFRRLVAYLPKSAHIAADRIDTAAIVIDDPGHGASSLADELDALGAFVYAGDGRLVIASTRETLVRARSKVADAARSLADEALRAFDADRARPPALRLRDRTLDLGERARVMGILNVTPDSFFDGGRYSGVDRARARAAEMVELGVDLIDIGGQSYASTVSQIDADEEAARVVPVVEALLRDGITVPLSIDTFKSSVAERALAAGAHCINDCSGLSDDRLADVVARADAGLVVMHLRGRLNVREAEYRYDDAMAEILGFLRERTDRALAAGVARDAIAIDPGLEFGKEPATDCEILDHFGDLRSLGYPILFAASRKSFIGRIFDRPPGELLVPSLASAAVGISAGARIVRVHDIAETVAVAQMLAAIAGERRLGDRQPQTAG